MGFVMLAMRNRVAEEMGVPLVSAVPDVRKVRAPPWWMTARAPGAPYARAPRRGAPARLRG